MPRSIKSSIGFKNSWIKLLFNLKNLFIKSNNIDLLYYISNLTIYANSLFKLTNFNKILELYGAIYFTARNAWIKEKKIYFLKFPRF